MTWTETLLEDETEREQALREFTLRTIRRGSDPINHWILREADRQRSIAVDELEAELGLSKSSVSERVNDLVQVGLLERNVDSDAVQPTVLTSGFLGIVDEITDRFADRFVDEFEPRTMTDEGRR